MTTPTTRTKAPYRIIQWGTGNVGRHALRTIVERPDFELVGLRVYNPDKVGKDAPIEWNADKDKAVARLDGGKIAEVVLKRFPGNTNDPVVIKNLKYWGVPRNDGFVLMPNEVEALRVVPEYQKPFEFKGTNGFMITFDMNSKDVAKG